MGLPLNSLFYPMNKSPDIRDFWRLVADPATVNVCSALVVYILTKEILHHAA